MAFFSGKKNTKTDPAESRETKAISPVRGVRVNPASLSHIILNPRITEKATMHETSGAYTFDVAERASKREIMQAVRELYKVTPRMVRVVTIPRKMKRNARTGKLGMKGGGKKAYVYLKKGDTITIR